MDTSATLRFLIKKLKQENEPDFIALPQLSKPIQALHIARLRNLHKLWRNWKPSFFHKISILVRDGANRQHITKYCRNCVVCPTHLPECCNCLSQGCKGSKARLMYFASNVNLFDFASIVQRENRHALCRGLFLVSEILEF